MDADTDPLHQYVWHPFYIDALAVTYYDADTDNSGIEELYATFDANFNVTAPVNSSGTVQERYEYDSYGQPSILDADFSSDADGASDKKNDILFGRYRYDVESGLYHVRNRILHPSLGRWVQRDPAGYVDGMSLYSLLRESPTTLVDPSGAVPQDPPPTGPPTQVPPIDPGPHVPSPDWTPIPGFTTPGQDECAILCDMAQRDIRAAGGFGALGVVGCVDGNPIVCNCFRWIIPQRYWGTKYGQHVKACVNKCEVLHLDWAPCTPGFRKNCAECVVNTCLAECLDEYDCDKEQDAQIKQMCIVVKEMQSSAVLLFCERCAMDLDRDRERSCSVTPGQRWLARY